MFTENFEFECQADAELLSNRELIAAYEDAERAISENPSDFLASIKVTAYGAVLRLRNPEYFSRY